MSSLPTVVSSIPLDLRRFLDRVREAFGSGTGTLVTTGDLVNGGLASLGAAGNLLPPAGTVTPPAPMNVAASGAMTSVIIDWDDPTYRGHSYAEIWRASTDDIGTAVLIGQSPGAVFSDAVGHGSSHYYWVRFVSTTNTLGPFNAALGTLGVTSPDPAYLLSMLTGEITATQLYTGLGARIDLIDGPSTTIGTIPNKIAQLQGQIDAVVSYPDYSGSATYTVDQIVKYSGAIYRAFGTTTGNLPTNVTYWEKIGDYTSIGDAVAAHTTEIGTLTTNLAAEATARDMLAAQMRGTYTGTDIASVTAGVMYSEKQTRATADTALSSSLTALSSTVTSNASAITASLATESSTRASADTALSTSITALGSTVTTDISAVNTAIATESTTRASADTALSTNISSLSSTVTANASAATAALGTESSTRATADTALSSSLTALTSTVTTNNSTVTAAIASESTTRSSADTAISATVTALTSTVAGNTAAIGTESTTRASADSALSSSITTLGSTVSGNTAAISTEAATRATQTGELYAQYTVKVDVNGYVSGFGLASTLKDASPYSSFAIRSDEFYIASPSGPGVAPAMPFIVRTTSTIINGVTVPIGVYMTDAFIQNGSISNAKIGNAAIDTAKITDAAITSAKIADASIGTAKIQTAAITNALIGNEAVDTSNIRAAAITTAKIGDAQITNAKIGTAAIATANIMDAAIIDAKIYNLDAAKINTGYLNAGRIAAGSVTADKINANGLIIRDGSGNIILGAGSALNASYAASGTLNSDLTGSIAAAAASAIWSSVSGSGKPEDGATVGAHFGTNLTGYISSTNVSSYLEASVIGTAYIANAAITNALIGNAEVGTLKVAGNAIGFSGSMVGGGGIGFWLNDAAALSCVCYSGGTTDMGSYFGLVVDGGLVYTVSGPGITNSDGYTGTRGPATGLYQIYLSAGYHSVGFYHDNQAYDSARLLWLIGMR